MTAAWTVPVLWPGDTVVCIASGPSLTVEDVNYVRGRARVIVVNDNYLRAPWADVLYFCDSKWWQWHKARSEYLAFAGIKATLAEDVVKHEPGVRWLRNGGGEGLSDRPDELKTGSNSGFQAINLAVLLGAKRIVLLGYDMKIGPKGERHWFGRHPQCVIEAPALAQFAKRFDSLVGPLKKRGIEVLNASRDTDLTQFRRVKLVDALPA